MHGKQLSLTCNKGHEPPKTLQEEAMHPDEQKHDGNEDPKGRYIARPGQRQEDSEIGGQCKQSRPPTTTKSIEAAVG